MSALAAALAAVAAVVAPPSPAWVQIPAAELRANYDTIWAASDLHGHPVELERLLVASGLATSHKGRVHWNAAKQRQLFIVVGDLIDGGPDSDGLVRLLERLADEAPRADSRVLVLLGNHEVSWLMRKGSRAASSRKGRWFETLPAAAFVGNWLFAHAGYIDAPPGDEALRGYFERLAAAWARGGNDRYRALLPSTSIVEFHYWWGRKRLRAAMKAHLTELGLSAVVFGHDPDALGAPRTIALDRDGWLLKLDTGMKERASAGMFLRCDVAEALESGPRICRVLSPDGRLSPVPIVNFP